MKLGYQDAGSWTLMKSTPVDRAQGGLALRAVRRVEDGGRQEEPCRPDGHPRLARSTTSSFTERAPKLGGWVEFYRSPDRVNWTPTGVNVPDYPKLAQIWWQQIGDVNSGAFTPQEAMDRLAGEMDVTMARMQAADEASQDLRRLRPAPERGEGPLGMARQGERPGGEAREREAAGRDDRL